MAGEKTEIAIAKAANVKTRLIPVINTSVDSTNIHLVNRLAPVVLFLPRINNNSVGVTA